MLLHVSYMFLHVFIYLVDLVHFQPEKLFFPLCTLNDETGLVAVIACSNLQKKDTIYGECKGKNKDKRDPQQN